MFTTRSGDVGRSKRRSDDDVRCGDFRCGRARGRRKHRSIWKGVKEQGRARTGGDVEEELVGGRGYVLPEDREPQNHLQERAVQDRARPIGGAATAAQEGERMTAKHWRESMSPRSTNRSCLRSA